MSSLGEHRKMSADFRKAVADAASNNSTEGLQFYCGFLAQHINALYYAKNNTTSKTTAMLDTTITNAQRLLSLINKYLGSKDKNMTMELADILTARAHIPADCKRELDAFNKESAKTALAR